MGSRPGSRAARAVLLLAFLVGLVAAPALAQKGAPLDIRPGPAAITAEERAIEPDPSSGSESAVVLLEETLRNDDLGRLPGTERTYHLRAKVLSNEGRDLANVEIPFLRGESRLGTWWGRTILPDGQVLELKREELEEQTIVKATGFELRALKGALPGVVPGCVIDYGYKLTSKRVRHHEDVPLQKPWPVRELRYQWVPSQLFHVSFRIGRYGEHDVKATREGRTISVAGRSLPPFEVEAWMPPESEVRTGITLFYVSPHAVSDRFWDDVAKAREQWIEKFNRNRSALMKALTGMGMPAGADLRTRLRAVYEWLGKNVKHTGLRSSEDMEAVGGAEEDEADTADQLLEQRQGSGLLLDALYIGLARLLGADAHLVLATDRTDHYFEPQVKTVRQFDTAVVAVRLPGGSDTEAVFVDAGSGLPFGEVPWWATGSRALRIAPEGSQVITIPPTVPERNVSETRASIRFSEDGQDVLAEWTRAGTGARGFVERRRLRALAADARAKRLDDLCGAGGDTEVLEASVPELDDPAGPFQLACRTNRPGREPDAERDRYEFGFGGPWFEDVPDLPAARRLHAVVFHYTRTDRLILEVTPPAGFVPAEPSAPVRRESPFGSYELSIQATANGYQIARLFVLRAQDISPRDYGALRLFLDDVRKADRAPLVFRRERADE